MAVILIVNESEAQILKEHLDHEAESYSIGTESLRHIRAIVASDTREMEASKITVGRDGRPYCFVGMPDMDLHRNHCEALLRDIFKHSRQN